MVNIYLHYGRESAGLETCTRAYFTSIDCIRGYAIVCANKVPREDVERRKKGRSIFKMSYCNNTCYRVKTKAVNWQLTSKRLPRPLE